MQKINQLIYLTAFLMLVATMCMARTEVNQARIDDHPNYLHSNSFDDCITVSMKDEACHKGRCSDSTTYVHTCDFWNGTDCDYYSGRIDICNSTSCQNTTRHIVACFDSGFDFTCHSCTNGVCRNRTTHIDASNSESKTLESSASAFCDGCYIGIYVFDCIDNLINSFGRRLGGSK